MYKAAGPNLDTRAVYTRLLKYVRPYWKTFALAVLGLALVGLTEPVLPAMMKPLLDNGFGKGNTTSLWVIPAALMGLFFVRGVLAFGTTYLINWVSNKVLVDIRNEMFSKLIQMPASFYTRESAGKLVSRLVFEVNNLNLAAVHVLTAGIQESLVIVGLLALLLWINWQLTLIALVLIPVIAWAISTAGRRVRKLSADNLAVTGEMAHIVEEAVVCQKVIKVYAGQARESARFNIAGEKLRAFARRLAVAEAAVTPITQMLAAFAVSAVVMIAVYQSRTDQTSVGGFVSFVTAMLMLLAPLKRVSSISSNLQKGLASADVVFELLDQQTEIDTGTHVLGCNDEVIKGGIVFNHVSLRYPDAQTDAISDLSLSIAPGEVLALVGASGGGKTSLANLLLRFYEPSAGTISLDDHPLPSLTLKSLRAQIAVVSQETMLFNESIGANISFGAANQHKTDEAALMAAAEAAYLGETIRALPMGLSTAIGDNGNLLSGGQRQRLAIARAIYKDAPILVLDEATSALDNESERYVQEALSRLMRGRTTIVIAHRLSTVQNADRIIVLDGGKIVELGNHTQLLARGGIYARLFANESFES